MTGTSPTRAELDAPAKLPETDRKDPIAEPKRAKKPARERRLRSSAVLEDQLAAPLTRRWNDPGGCMPTLSLEFADAVNDMPEDRESA